MSRMLRKILHYCARIAISLLSWFFLSLASLLMIASFHSGESTIHITTLVPFILPFILSVGVFFLCKKPLNNSRFLYNPDAFVPDLSTIVNYCNTQNDTIDSTLYKIDVMDGLAFEHWCADLLAELDYTDVVVTRGSGDQGVDVLAQKDGIKYAIQCKCYSSNLGNTPVQEINTGKVIYHCHVGVVMTNRYFTEGAKEAAEATGVLLWDRDWIKAAMEKRGYLPTLESTNSPPPSIVINPHYDDDSRLLIEAVNIILETNYASVSILQRKLKIGYAQAARLMDIIEKKGIVGPFQGSKPRDILITKSQWISTYSNYIDN